MSIIELVGIELTNLSNYMPWVGVNNESLFYCEKDNYLLCVNLKTYSRRRYYIENIHRAAIHLLVDKIIIIKFYGNKTDSRITTRSEYVLFDLDNMQKLSTSNDIEGFYAGHNKNQTKIYFRHENELNIWNTNIDHTYTINIGRRIRDIKPIDNDKVILHAADVIYLYDENKNKLTVLINEPIDHIAVIDEHNYFTSTYGPNFNIKYWRNNNEVFTITPNHSYSMYLIYNDTRPLSNTKLINSEFKSFTLYDMAGNLATEYELDNDDSYILKTLSDGRIFIRGHKKVKILMYIAN